MFPLRPVDGGLGEYVLFGVRDLTALVDKLPKLCKGGAPWLSEFTSIMVGHPIAMGDIRQAMHACCSSWEVRRVEEVSGTLNVPDSDPLGPHAQGVFQAVKEVFPSPVDTAPTVLPWTSGLDPVEHYAKCVNAWITATGHHPSHSPEGTMVFRTAVLAGLPKKIQEELQKDPDLLAGEDTHFQRHVVHALKMYTQVEDKLKTENQEMQTSIVKIAIRKG
ncbi:hypothetical protein NQD34_018197 [Periophthalmus magnuspinnatus]|nr:hypothetical protein NQD34_018197 [Periophthalmus magnuspinnatus]